jgi:hypothetical protein
MALLRRKAQARQEEGPSAMTLHEAVARGLVSVELFGAGQGVVSTARLAITKHTDGPLRLHIPVGTSFTPVQTEIDLPKGTS